MKININNHGIPYFHSHWDPYTVTYGDTSGTKDAAEGLDTSLDILSMSKHTLR